MEKNERLGSPTTWARVPKTALFAVGARRLAGAWLFGGLAAAASAAFAYVSFRYPAGHAVKLGVVTLVPVALASASARGSFRRAAADPARRAAFRWLGAAMLVQALAVLLASFVQVTSGVEQSVVAAAGDVLNGALMTVALASFAGRWRSELHLRAGLDALIIACATFGVLWASSFGRLYHAARAPDVGGLVIAFVDTVNVSLALLVASRWRGGPGRVPVLVTCGIFLQVTADVLFAHAALAGTYHRGHPFWNVWIAALVCFALVPRWPLAVAPPPPGPERDRGAGAIQIALPYLPLVLLGALFGGRIVSSEGAVDPVLGSTFGAASLLALVRQFFALVDHRELARTLEEQVALRTAALAASEARYRLLAEHIADVVWSSDPDGRLSYLSPSYARIGGHPANAVRHLEELFTQDSHARLRAALPLDGGPAPGAPSAPLELQMRFADGPRWVEVRVAPVRTPSGHVSHVVGACRDIEDRRRAAAERLRLQEELARALRMEAVGRLAGGVAHDFNNVLTVIVGYGEVAAASVDAGGDPRPALREIGKAAQKASAMIRQLLTFARGQATRPGVLDLNGAIENARGLLSRLAGPQVELELELEARAPVVSMDAPQLDQILVNLAANARAAMPDGGRLVVATRDVAPAGGDGAPAAHVELLVSDTGVGMSDEVRRHIFEPFFTTRAPGEGTGLGLSVVYGIVERCGGRIDVASAEGRGATFRIVLPRATGTRDEGAQRRPGSAAPAADETGRR